MIVYHYDINIIKLKANSTSEDQVSTSDGKDGGDTGDERQQRARELFIKKFADHILAKFAKDNGQLFEGLHYAYDGSKNLYTTKALNFRGDELFSQVELMIGGRNALFQVKVTLAARVAMGEAVDFYNGKSGQPVSEHVIAVFDVILRHVIGKSYSTYQRKFFDTDDVESVPRIKLVDFVQGFMSSVRMTDVSMQFL